MLLHEIVPTSTDICVLPFMTKRALSLVLLAACGGGTNDSTTMTDTPDAMPACTTATYYPDVDGDGYGDMAVPMSACEAPAGYIARGGDCDDTDAKIHPGVAEVCDGKDNDCNGMTDDADPGVAPTTQHAFYKDGDGDGFGDAQHEVKACAAPSGFVENDTDCDDSDGAINPSAAEVCDGKDNNCNGMTDSADPAIDMSTEKSYYKDADHDGYGAGAATLACDMPSGFVMQAGDCNDSDATAKPNGVETCDGVDNDCDGSTDGGMCSALVGTYTGTYSHQTTEHIGSTVINQVTCSGTGSVTLALAHRPSPLHGTFTCVYNGGLTAFDKNESMTLDASVGLDGKVTGTIDHLYESLGSNHHVYAFTGTLTSTKLTITGTGSWLPNAMSAVPWDTTFSVSASR